MWFGSGYKQQLHANIVKRSMRAMRAYFLFLDWRGAIISLSQLFLFLFYIVHFIHSIISKDIIYARWNWKNLSNWNKIEILCEIQIYIFFQISWIFQNMNIWIKQLNLHFLSNWKNMKDYAIFTIWNVLKIWMNLKNLEISWN